jgi:hypothetical protein
MLAIDAAWTISPARRWPDEQVGGLLCAAGANKVVCTAEL